MAEKRRRSREPRLSPRRLAAAKKAQQALELRLAGRRWEEIRDALGYRHHATAIRAVDTLLARTAQQSVDHHRVVTLERLTKVAQVFWPEMLRGDRNAAAVVLKALADIRQLLGLDAPVKVQVDIRSEAERIAKELGLDPIAVMREAERILGK